MSLNQRTAISVAAFVAATLSLQPAMAQRHERKLAQLGQSAQATPVAGGIIFQSLFPYDKFFDAVTNYLKRNGHEIESSNKETGAIVTAMEIAGKYTQTGTRIHVTLIKDSETQTSVRVTVAVQKRKKLLQTEPWSEPKLDEAQSRKTAVDIEEALKSL
jgi:hypothetical protein